MERVASLIFWRGSRSALPFDKVFSELACSEPACSELVEPVEPVEWAELFRVKRWRDKLGGEWVILKFFRSISSYFTIIRYGKYSEFIPGRKTLWNSPTGYFR